jgi:hypothetical protein
MKSKKILALIVGSIMAVAIVTAPISPCSGNVEFSPAHHGEI